MDVTLPALGENIEEAEVLQVLVREGDAVDKDQSLLELKADKGTFELPCPQPGRVTAVHVKKGDTIRVGDKVLTVGAGGGSPPQKDRRPERVPRDGEAPDQDEAPMSVRARAPEEGPARGESRADETAERDRGAAASGQAVAAGPATRRLARERGVELARIRGTGSGGRITIEDVEGFIRGRGPAGRAAAELSRPAAPAGSAVAPADAERWGAVERRPLTGIEKAAVRHLAASWREIPHVTHHDLADVTELEGARARLEAERKEGDAKLTWTVLVVKAAVAALRAFPRVNSSLDGAREELVLKRYTHIGIAVDTEHGLLVPVLRDADRKTTRAIATEIARLAARAREGKLARDEMQGASFTVTNLGGIGGVAFTPIVSHPEVASLGVSRSREELVLEEGRPVPRIVLPLSLSYDGRVISGAEAARFVRYVADLLESPLYLLVES